LGKLNILFKFSGFGQGGCMALKCGLEYPKELGGILSYSGFLLSITKLMKKNKNIPILISHGKLDYIINWQKAKLSYRELE